MVANLEVPNDENYVEETYGQENRSKPTTWVVSSLQRRFCEDNVTWESFKLFVCVKYILYEVFYPFGTWYF